MRAVPCGGSFFETNPMSIKKLFTFFVFLPFLGWSQSVTIGTSINSTNGFLYGPYFRSNATSTTNYSRYAYLYTSNEY